MSIQIVLSDPPWPQTKGNTRKCRPQQGKTLDYPTLTLEEIETIHRKVLQGCDSKHNVFLWAIDKYLPEAEEMMKSLGYKLHARLIWDKENGIAPAFTLRFSHEYLLWWYKPGKILMPTESQRGKFTTVMREASERHSQKPQCAYEMIEAMFPDTSRLELFARRKRDGWLCLGNEIDGTDLRSIV